MTHVVKKPRRVQKTRIIQKPVLRTRTVRNRATKKAVIGNTTLFLLHEIDRDDNNIPTSYRINIGRGYDVNKRVVSKNTGGK